MNKKSKNKDLTSLLFQNGSEVVLDEQPNEPLKALDEEQDHSDDEVVKLQASYPFKALGMYPVKDGPSMRYVLVEIPYDPATGDVGFVKEVTRDVREDAIDRFKVLVMDNKFFGE